MKPIKTVISILLLFCYSLGFAHNLVPHGEHEHRGHSSNTHEHECTIADSKGHEHAHFAHADHLDAGLLDFMKCLLIDFDHNEANLEFFQTQNILVLKAPLESILHIEFQDFDKPNPVITGQASLKDESSPHHYSYLFLSSPSKRGPPSIS